MLRRPFVQEGSRLSIEGEASEYEELCVSGTFLNGRLHLIHSNGAVHRSDADGNADRLAVLRRLAFGVDYATGHGCEPREDEFLSALERQSVLAEELDDVLHRGVRIR